MESVSTCFHKRVHDCNKLAEDTKCDASPESHDTNDELKFDGTVNKWKNDCDIRETCSYVK